jgi:hypothetical protein
MRYSEDCPQYLQCRDTKPVPRDRYRLLKQGSIRKLRVPNLIGLLDLLRASDNQSIEAQERLVQCAYGTQANEGDYQYTAFTRALLGSYLREAGFVNIRFAPKDVWFFDVEAERP